MDTLNQLPELSLSELFAMADAIGNKYQTVEEISAFRQRLLAEAAALPDDFDYGDETLEDVINGNLA